MSRAVGVGQSLTAGAPRGEPTPAATDGQGVIERCGIPMPPWPVRRPADYLQWVNEAQTAAQEQAVRLSVTRGRPFGDLDWQARTTGCRGREPAFRPTGRPRKAETAKEPKS